MLSIFKRFALTLLVFCLSVLPVACGSSSPGDAKASEFLKVTSEDVAALTEASKGRVLLLCFWTTWCPSCREEMQDLVSIRNTYPQDQLRVVAVSLDEDEEDLVEFFSDQPAVEVVHGNAQVARDYEISAIPHMYVYDKDGGLVFSRPGSFPRAMLEGMIQTLISR